jgi:hypothetical protein
MAAKGIVVPDPSTPPHQTDANELVPLNIVDLPAVPYPNILPKSAD